jgi:hypothetical protein
MQSTLPLLVLAVFMASCASQQTTQTQPATSAAAETKAAPTTPGARTVKSRNGKFDGEIVGTPAVNGKFSKLHIGMTMREVQGLIGVADDMYRHETGKRWIPFYFGNDSQRFQVLYKGEGCLTYTGGNVFGGGENELIRIAADSKGRCFNE